MPTFKAPGKQAFKNIVEKGKKMLVTSVFFLFDRVSSPIKKCIIRDTMKLSSANAFNLDTAKLLSPGYCLINQNIHSILTDVRG